jgi:GNAT superfamily N-acetyltransferase
MDNIKKELSDGWELVSAKDGKYVVAAVFFRLDDSDLLTKNTGIRPEAQGSGFSHQIKEFLEVKAKEVGAKKLLHYCRIDNFRMYSLNESHGYKKSKRPQEDPHIVEWVKEVK